MGKFPFIVSIGSLYGYANVIFLFRATNPSQFEIEFFVNDLEKPGACTFESIGGFEYKQNGSIHLECKRKVNTFLLFSLYPSEREN